MNIAEARELAENIDKTACNKNTRVRFDGRQVGGGFVRKPDAEDSDPALIICALTNCACIFLSPDTETCPKGLKGRNILGILR